MFYKKGKYYSREALKLSAKEKREILKRSHPQWNVKKLTTKQVHYLYQEEFLVLNTTKLEKENQPQQLELFERR